MIIIAAAIALISYRLGDRGIESIDRVLFLRVFAESFGYTKISNVLFGHGFAAELPTFACQRLNYWLGDSTLCTASVFHSFLLRLAYETGLIGVAFIYGLWLFLLTRYFGKFGFTMFVVISICSLSVSAFNNSIVLWPLFLGVFVRTGSPRDETNISPVVEPIGLTMEGDGIIDLPEVQDNDESDSNETPIMPVNINIASAEVLAKVIVGVGISRAQAIVDYRETHGQFDSAEALIAVMGIGRSTIVKNTDRIVVL